MPSNTILSKGDKRLVTEFMNGEFSSDFYDDHITAIRSPSPFSHQDITTIELPNLTTIITNSAAVGTQRQTEYAGFASCTNLKRATLPNLTSSGERIFQNCTSLESVDFPLYNISANLSIYYQFSGCTSLKTVNLPSLVNMKDYMFEDCEELENIYLPSVNCELNNRACWVAVFNNCIKLRRVYLPAQTYAIGANATYRPFTNCPSMEIFRLPSLSAALTSDIASPAWEQMKLADIGSAPAIDANIESYIIRYCKILILRKTDDITTLANSTAFTPSSTPVPIKVYVPSALISAYEAATNWSTALANGYVVFLALEGSRFEDPNFDDTDIYNADRDDLDELL